MNIIDFLVPLAITLGGSFVIMFVLSTRNGQYDDLETPAHRVLLEDETQRNPSQGSRL